MKPVAQSFAYLVIIISLAMPSMGGPNPAFKLTIAAPKEPLKPGTELQLLVTVTNTSNHAISFMRSPGPVPEEGFRYKIEVRDAHGHPAPPSAYVRGLSAKRTITWSSNLGRTLSERSLPARCGELACRGGRVEASQLNAGPISKTLQHLIRNPFKINTYKSV